MGTLPRDTDRIILTIDELKQLSKATTLDTLSALGIDTSQPVEVQKDFAFIRTWREGTESIRGKTLCAIVTVLISGALAALWLGIKSCLR